MALTEKLTAIGDAVRSQTGTTEAMTLDEMATAINNLETGKEYNWGRGLNYNPDTNTVAVKVSSPVVFNGTTITVNQNDMFITGSNEWIVNETWEEALVPAGEVVVFDTGAVISDEEISNWFANLTSDTEIVAQVGSPMGWFGTTGMTTTIQAQTAGLDGITYDYLLDFTGALGPSTQANIGAIGFEVGYVNGNIYFIVKLNPEVATPNFTGAKLGEVSIEKALAHYYIGNRNQFNLDNRRIEINEDYINGLIDAKLDAIPVAEGVSV